MITRKQIKLIKSLSLKKNRDKLGLFIAEGHRSIDDLIQYFEYKSLFCTQNFFISRKLCPKEDIHIITEKELSEISLQQAPQDAIAIFKKKELAPLQITNSLTLALDHIQDPGNLGTIIRLADWFGINNIICSIDTVDCYSPKVVQATMGALSRVNIYYKELSSFLPSQKLPIYGTFLHGENIYKTKLPNSAIIVMGNEGNGIHENLRPYINHQISIPSYPLNSPSVESLNVAIATSIICSEFRRTLI